MGRRGMEARDQARGEPHTWAEREEGEGVKGEVWVKTTGEWEEVC